MPETPDPAATGQVNAEAARIYDEFFVPALFAEWAQPVCDAAEINLGDRVIDIACGTGVATREAAKRAGGRGKVTALTVIPACWRLRESKRLKSIGARAALKHCHSMTAVSMRHCASSA